MLFNNNSHKKSDSTVTWICFFLTINILKNPKKIDSQHDKSIVALFYFIVIFIGVVSFIQKELSTNKWSKKIIQKSCPIKIFSKLTPLHIKEDFYQNNMNCIFSYVSPGPLEKTINAIVLWLVNNNLELNFK